MYGSLSERLRLLGFSMLPALLLLIAPSCGTKSEADILNGIYKTFDVESLAAIPGRYKTYVVRTTSGAVVFVRDDELVQLLPKVEMGKVCFDEVPEPTI